MSPRPPGLGFVEALEANAALNQDFHVICWIRQPASASELEANAALNQDFHGVTEASGPRLR